MIKKVHVIINPVSGQPQPILPTINSVFHPADVEWDVSVTLKSGDATRAAQKAAADGVDLIAAYGGDGTVMEVASALIGSDTPMAILPGGTANVVSVELGIPKDLAKACQVIVDEKSQLRAIDIGTAEGRNFLHRVGIGLAAEKVKGATREMKDRYGTLAYSIAWFKSAKNPPTAKYQLVLDEKAYEVEGFTCIVANSGSMGAPGFNMSKETSVSDGLLDVFVIHDSGFFSTLSAFAGSVTGRREPNPDTFHHWQAKNIRIETDPPLSTQGDGEVWGETPISISVIPHAVEVIVPQV